MTARPTAPAAPTGAAEVFTIRLPLPPVGVNGAYRGAYRGGRLLLTDEAKAWKEQVAWLTREARNVAGSLPKPPYSLYVWWFWPNRRWDEDGPLKLLQDAIFVGLGLNDNLVAEAHLFKRLDKVNPRIDCVIRTATQD